MMYCKKNIVSRLILLVGTFFWACSSENVSSSNDALDGIVNGVSQKGPFLEGSSVTMQELDGKSLAQTGKSFKGKVINDRGDFSIENVSLDHPYALLEVNGYYRNEVTGKKSNGSIFMKALADVSKQPKVNINLLTHLEYERVQTLMEQNNMSIEEAKRQADREIFAAFYADVDYDKVEHLSIFGNGEGDAALLAINVLLLGEESEVDFMERFVSIGQDLAVDGVWNDSLLKIKIADFACEASRSGKLAEIRRNIESWKIADVPSFETYVNRFWANQYRLGKCDASNLGMRKLFVDSTESSVFQDSAFKCSENGWIPDPSNEAYSRSIAEKCSLENEGEIKAVWEGNPKYGYINFCRCKGGLWVSEDIRLTCDTAGVQVGDLCRRTRVVGTFAAGMGVEGGVEFFVYAGNGIWEDYDPKTKIIKKCTENNDGDIVWLYFDEIPSKRDTIWYEDVAWNIFDETPGRKDTVLYECHNGEWTNIKITGYNLDDITPSCLSENPVEGDTCSFNDEYKQRDYQYKNGKWVIRDGFKDNCSTEGAVEGDTCSFEWHGEREAYMYIDGKWYPSKADPKLGYCPEHGTFLNLPRFYKESEGNYYYCQDGDWNLLNLVPRQYTDSRKEGLTDEEFDMLDLPKDAKEGDRIGGLLEDCWSDVEFYVSDPNGEGRNEIYDYCMPRHYYLYRENGSWTLETPEEFAAYKRIPYYDGICSPELLGTRVLSYGKRFCDPDEIYECVYDTLKNYPYPESTYESLKYRYWRVGLIFERSVKKN